MRTFNGTGAKAFYTFGMGLTAVLVACIAGCGGADRFSELRGSGPFIVSIYPYHQEVADAITEFAQPMQVVVQERADYRSPNFIGHVRWDASASRSIGRPYEYRRQEERSADDNRIYLSRIFSGFGNFGMNEVYKIESSITFSDHRSYRFPEVYTWDDQETVEIFCHMVAKAAQWTREGERMAVRQLRPAVRLRALEDLQDRIERIESGARRR